MANLEAGAADIRSERQVDFESLSHFLHEPFDAAELLTDISPVDEAKLHRARLFINYAVARAMKDNSDFGYSAEEQQKHRVQSDKVKREIRHISRWLLSESRREIRQRQQN